MHSYPTFLIAFWSSKYCTTIAAKNKGVSQYEAKEALKVERGMVSYLLITISKYTFTHVYRYVIMHMMNAYTVLLT